MHPLKNLLVTYAKDRFPKWCKKGKPGLGLMPDDLPNYSGQSLNCELSLLNDVLNL